MNFIIWNIRGLNDPFKQKEVKLYIRRFRHYEGDCSWLKFLWWQRGHYLGRIRVCSDQLIHCAITLPQGYSFYASFVYGSNSGIVRKNLWSNLHSLKSQIGDQPCLIGGDFNILKGPDERFGGLGSISFQEEFCHYLIKLEVLDHPYIGPLYTWTSRSEDFQFKAWKLDKIPVNPVRFYCFPPIGVEFLLPGVFDHATSFMFSQVLVNSYPKPFQFFNFWTDHPKFMHLVSSI